ncbi:hypothetical protein [Candidatus Leptofilum sp.]|uniref:hypothetical protein n=1 Tax=Candidatus Leptofilum sp. TaxID=3241576 RepID=UPI003B5C1823
MKTKSHALFEAYPLQSDVEIPVGRVPTPYQTYDGHGTLIGGTADLGQVQSLLQNETVHPLQTEGGRAVMGIWVVDFTEASLGPHKELQFSFLVAHQPQPPVASHPLTLLKALFVNPAARMFCYGLWNDTETAVAYNRELLGLDAQLTKAEITRTNGQKRFRFVNSDGEMIFAGQVQEATRPVARVGWSLLRLLGWRQTVNALRRPYLGAKVVNPISDRLPYNADAQSYIAADQPLIQFFDPATDLIEFGPANNGQFDFQPQFIEHFAPFRFVYLNPEKI